MPSSKYSYKEMCASVADMGHWDAMRSCFFSLGRGLMCGFDPCHSQLEEW